MNPTQLSLTEHAVLALLAEGPAHGFALWKDLARDSPVGRILTVRQPLVYRALNRLVEAGLAEPAGVEPGEAGPQRLVHRITGRGRRHLTSWLSQPVRHVRDLRVEFLLKIAFFDRSGISPRELVDRQRTALRETLTALSGPGGETTDPIGLWRRHQATAAAAYLADLDDLYCRRTATPTGSADA